MQFTFTNKRIAGIVSVVPKQELHIDDEMQYFDAPIANSQKMKKMMGFDRHRIAPPHVTASDLCLYGVEHLLANNLLVKDEIDALIFVSQTPDHFIPPTSNILHGKLKLKQDTLCIDVNQGCVGFVLGVYLGWSLLDQPQFKKVVLLNGDTASKQTNIRDRATYSLVGDAGSVTVLERTTDGRRVFGNVKNDGTRSNALLIPAGAYRNPSSEETRKIVREEDGNWRAQEHIHMDGAAIFDFTLREVVPMIDDALALSGKTKDDIDFFLLHQPNRFILQRLAGKMGIAEDRMPNTVVENFGNPSSVSIPLVACFNLGSRLLQERFTVCMASFGVGLTWASIVTELGNLAFCDILDYPE